VKLLIRPATRDDIAVMMALEKHAATAAHWSLAQHSAVFERSDPRWLALVVEAPEEALEEGPEKAHEETNRKETNDRSGVQGFLVARALGNDWEVENIAVSGPARRRGLGTRLLGEFLSLARAEGASAVFLEVRESSVAARNLYEKWAFVETGRRPGYYSSPDEDALIYRLDFA
jgi:ribosomal protein S18 acetylase RimI-like enzyme